MKKQVIYFLGTIFFFVIWINTPFAQGPGEPFYPMTANGAKGISKGGHMLFWKNPDSTIYNKIYFSDDFSSVEALNPNALLLNGYPDSVFTSVNLNLFGWLKTLSKYYWRVVEYNQMDSTLGSVWYFKSTMSLNHDTLLFDDFENPDFTNENWTIVNDGGTCVWEQYFPPYPNYYELPCYSNCGGVLAADSDECGNGTTLLSSAIIGPFPRVESYGKLEFDQDFNAFVTSDEAWVETSTDNGLTWNAVWSQIGTDLRSTHETIDINTFTDFLIRFRSVQPNWAWWWVIDNVFLLFDPGLVQVPVPPRFLQAEADSSELIVNLNWDNGLCEVSLSGYEIVRKDGLPLDTSSYTTLVTTDENTFNFIDNSVLPNHIYTYKIRVLCGPPGYGSIWGNEATAYVQQIVPVELINFTANVINTKVQLFWQTATETNNSGFNVERRTPRSNSRITWKTIGFVQGHGTTTKQHNYTFTDSSVISGKHQYRLKQIDYNGTYEHSKIIEVEIAASTKFSLEQNYPNPFNPSTKIKFAISKSPLLGGDGRGGLQLVKLIVYDVLGNEVTTLVNEEKLVGNYEVEFDATGLPSGVYLYRLTAGNFSDVKKLILIK